MFKGRDGKGGKEELGSGEAVTKWEKDRDQS